MEELEDFSSTVAGKWLLEKLQAFLPKAKPEVEVENHQGRERDKTRAALAGSPVPIFGIYLSSAGAYSIPAGAPISISAADLSRPPLTR